MRTNKLFLAEFIKDPKIIGSIIPSSPFLIRSMLNKIEFQKAKCIVEIGAGTGVLTEIIIKKIPLDCKLVIFEINGEFAKILQQNYGHRAIIINDSIENINMYSDLFKNKVSYFISSLPISFLSRNRLKKLLMGIYNMLEKGGKFVQYQYSLASKRVINSVFDELTVEFVLFNIPPAYVYACSK